MLNAGSALDILRLRREDEGGTREETAFACHLLNGIPRRAGTGTPERAGTPARRRALL